MAWISVHEQVLSGKLRNLAKKIGCSQNEALGMLVRLWLWSINNTGKEGRIEGADKEDIAEILNIGIDKNISSKKAVDALIETNWIEMDDCLYIHDWEEWQEQWYKALEVRERDAERKRKERAAKREARQAKNMIGEQKAISTTKVIEEDLPVPKLIILHQEETKSKSAVSYSKEFEEFWKVYPRKVGKGEAYKKYVARLNDGWKELELLEAAQTYANKCIRERTEARYIKHPKTFLSDSTPFKDYLKDNMQEITPASSIINEDDPFGDWRR